MFILSHIFFKVAFPFKLLNFGLLYSLSLAHSFGQGVHQCCSDDCDNDDDDDVATCKSLRCFVLPVHYVNVMHMLMI